MTAAIRDLYYNVKQSDINNFTRYWEEIRPNGDRKREFRFWMFSVFAANMGWEDNVKCMEAVGNYEDWIDNRAELERRLYNARTGMWQNKARDIHAMAQRYWHNYNSFVQQAHENCRSYRDRIAATIPGLGLAKSAFAIGMLNWKCLVVCLDRMVLKGIHALGTRQVTNQQYRNMENQWITLASDYDVKPFIVREIWWTKLQGFKSTRYWSKTLE
jgi:hypothetical protein